MAAALTSEQSTLMLEINPESSRAKMINHLKQQGLIFLAKNNVYEVPIVGPQLGTIFRTPEAITTARQHLETCQDFLSMDVMLDDFNQRFPDPAQASNERHKWQDRMFAEYGEDFAELYRHNKIRSNSFQAIAGGLQLLATLLPRSPENSELQTYLIKNGKNLIRAVSGYTPQYNYNHMTTVDKLSILRLYDATIIDLLFRLARPNVKTTQVYTV